MQDWLLMNIGKKLSATMDWSVDWEVAKSNTENGTDGKLVLVKNSKSHAFPVEVKKEFRNHHLLGLIEAKKRLGELTVIAEIIPTKLKQQLREHHIGYIDGAGNIYLENKGLFVLVEGQKREIPKQKYRTRAFTKSGLKVVFHLLLNGELANKPYRKVAEIADVSTDTISKTFASLQSLGFLIKLDKKQFRLHRKKELLERWIYQYGDKLKPSLFIGQFRFLDKTTYWQKVGLRSPASLWGAEPAAALLTNYLRPEILTLYTEENTGNLMKQYRLVPDENGEIQVFKKFWNLEMYRGNTVHPLLVYAGLMYSGFPRNLETAERIYEQYLQNLF